jgi:hypothetical protein
MRAQNQLPKDDLAPSGSHALGIEELYPNSHQTVGCHNPLIRVASKSPGQGGMAM